MRERCGRAVLDKPSQVGGRRGAGVGPALCPGPPAQHAQTHAARACMHAMHFRISTHACAHARTRACTHARKAAQLNPPPPPPLPPAAPYIDAHRRSCSSTWRQRGTRRRRAGGGSWVVGFPSGCAVRVGGGLCGPVSEGCCAGRCLPGGGRGPGQAAEGRPEPGLTTPTPSPRPTRRARSGYRELAEK